MSGRRLSFLASGSGESAGFTLVEILLSLSILAFLLLIIFGGFAMASGVFYNSLLKQSAENQLRAIKGLLEHDISLSDFWMMNVIKGSDGTNARDAFSLPGLDDWREDSNFDSVTDRPRWNRHIVWYSTPGSVAELHRQLVAPPPSASGFLDVPYGALSSNIDPDDPLANQNLRFSQTLTEDLLNFEILNDAGTGTVSIKVQLRAEGSRRGAGTNTTVAQLGAVLDFRPKNTWPRI